MNIRAHYDALRGGVAVLDRRERVRLRLTGTDRRSYLQGLLTNDVANLGAGEARYAALLTPQGRMITDMRVLETGDAVLIDLPALTGAAVRDRLEQFIFSEDAQVEEVTATLAQFGVYGPGAAAAVQAARAGRDAIVVASDDYGVDGFEVFVPAADADAFLAALETAGAVTISGEAAAIARIEAGRPEYGVDMTEDTIPLEAGIEDRAISRTKGCYVGQEIIIRVLDRGQGRVARRLVRLVLPADAQTPAAGAPIASGDRAIGAVTSAVRSIALDRPVALGYVHRDFAEAGTEVSIGGVPARVSP